MDVKYVNPFLEAIKRTLEQLDVIDFKRGNITKKDNMHVDMDITAVVGIVGDIRGNVAYSFSQETAKQIVSAMMMGATVTTLDSLARSAIGELSNMITGASASLFSGMGKIIDITPPSIIFGKDIYFVISSVQTISVDIETRVGKIQVNIGLEV